MTKDQQAALEQVAREYADKFCAWRSPSMPQHKRECLRAIFVEALAAQRAEVLEEVETEIVWLWEEGQISQSARDAAIARLSKQAQEQRP